MENMLLAEMHEPPVILQLVYTWLQGCFLGLLLLMPTAIMTVSLYWPINITRHTPQTYFAFCIFIPEDTGAIQATRLSCMA